MSVSKRVHAFLVLAEKDLEAAEALARIPNRYDAFHVQQGLEKLLKAILLARGLEAGTEHRLVPLLDRLPVGDPWRERLGPLLDYSDYATAFRYPTPGGRIVDEPEPAKVLADAHAARALIALALDELRLL